MKKILTIIAAVLTGSVTFQCAVKAEEAMTDYSYLEDMSIKQLKELDNAIHQLIGGTVVYDESIVTVAIQECDYEKIYSAAVQKIKTELEQNGNDWNWLEYALYDMNQDGYAELLIQKGTCNADMMYEIYTTDGQNAVYAGEVLGMAQEIYAAPAEKGFYTYFGRQMVDTINLVSLENGEINTVEIFNGENVGYTNSYDELQTKIGTRYLGDGVIWEESDLMEIQATESEYIFPESDQKYLTEDEVRNMNDELLLYGRNEIYARHGYIFSNEQIRQHFENTSWYVGTVSGDQFDPSVFNEYENANLELILRIEAEKEVEYESSVDYTGGYIDGTDDSSNYIVMTQEGNTVSYEWYLGNGEYSCGESNLPINEDGSVWGSYWAFWFENESTLKVSSGIGTSVHTFWKISGENAIRY